MSRTSEAIDDLLKESEVNNVETLRVIPRRRTDEVPDALVLCEITTVCEGCGREYKHPNPHVLGRFGRNHKRIKKWSSLFERLNREILVLTEKATSCGVCFQSCVIRTSDMED